eukprot:CAMPEP_0174934746 /NCGR_PEP_ID=MMETSP1355-20121228/50799_1 /TAXON_ID=464990 /ORGANISM="Hemiselmis tepida, Strain CCMP443" /LENGTH=298 /DNA_ID=CAMNT_0016181379 /DNA_START=66 /DNA_END=962 /DNA_ORIENTATION=+
MVVFVRTLEGRTLCVDGGETGQGGLRGGGMLVDELQGSIERATGILPCEQRLVYGGAQLSASKRLEDYGITPGGGQTVHLLLSLKGGMPATAPRIKMPANNRMHSSAALRTTDMWSNVIGDDFGKANDASGAAAGGSGQGNNAYEMSQNLMALARLSGASKGDAKRGACKRCGEIGHLAFQCFNHVQAKKQVAGDISSTSSDEDDDEDDNKSIGSVSSTSSEGDSPRRPPSIMVQPKASSSSGKKRSRDDDDRDKEKERKKRKKDKKDKKEKKSKDKDKKKKKHKKSKKEKKSKKDRD